MLSQQGYMRLYAHQKLYQDVSDALTSNLAIAKCKLVNPGKQVG